MGSVRTGAMSAKTAIKSMGFAGTCGNRKRLDASAAHVLEQDGVECAAERAIVSDAHQVVVHDHHSAASWRCGCPRPIAKAMSAWPERRFMCHAGMAANCNGLRSARLSCPCVRLLFTFLDWPATALSRRRWLRCRVSSRSYQGRGLMAAGWSGRRLSATAIRARRVFIVQQLRAILPGVFSCTCIVLSVRWKQSPGSRSSG